MAQLKRLIPYWFYQSAAWLAVAQCAKIRAGHICEAPGCHERAEVVHHKRTIFDAPHLALELGNVEALCWGHHAHAHGRVQRVYRGRAVAANDARFELPFERVACCTKRTLHQANSAGEGE